MKGYVYDARSPEGVAERTDLPEPTEATLPNHHCIVEVKACGVNPVDAKYCVGDKLPHFLHSLGRYFMNGRVIGFDFAGVVKAVKGCDGMFAVGDRVFGAMPPMYGSFAELIVAPVSQMAHIPTQPQELSYAAAAALPLVSITAVQALKFDHGLRTGQSVAIIGASGGVGCVASQVAKALVGESGLVCGVCSGRNAQFAKDVGCDVVLNYTLGTEKLLHKLRDTLSQHSMEHFDLVLDCVTSLEEKERAYCYVSSINAAGLVKRDLNHPTSRSNYITIGGTTYDWTKGVIRRCTGWNLFGGASPSWNYELFWIRFPNCGEYAPRRSDAAHGGGALKDVKELVEAGHLKTEGLYTVLHNVMGSDGAQKVREAFSSLHTRRVRGKLVLEM